MRFAFVSFKYFPYGGLEKDMLRMAECAAMRGHETVIVTGAWLDDSMPDIPNLSVKIIPVSGSSNHAKAKSFCRSFKKYLEEEHFDCTLALNRVPGCDFYFAADNWYAVEMPKKHAKWILNILPRYKTYLALENAVASTDSDTVILYIADRQKSDYQQHYNTPDERFILLPPGMNPACKRNENADAVRVAKRKELGVEENEFVLLLVGSNFRQKGGDRAITALAQAPEHIKKMCKIFFAGADKPDYCRKLAEKLGIGDNIIFLGARKDVPDLLVSCDVLLLPARNEAAGAVIAEAISSGAPLIVSSECGHANYAEQAGGIVLPKEWNDAAFTNAICEIYTQKEKYLQHAIEYSSTVDYTKRADITIDIMENFAER